MAKSRCKNCKKLLNPAHATYYEPLELEVDGVVHKLTLQRSFIIDANYSKVCRCFDYAVVPYKIIKQIDIHFKLNSRRY